MSDNYQIFNPSTEFGPNGHWEEIPLEFRPDTHLPVPTVNLKRGYGYDLVYDTTDRKPAPKITTLSAVLEFEAEEDLSSFIEWWMYYLSGATRYKRRSTGEPEDIRGGWITSSPNGDEGSNVAVITINLRPARVAAPRKPTGKLRGF